jgi:hypothetical protein
MTLGQGGSPGRGPAGPLYEPRGTGGPRLARGGAGQKPTSFISLSDHNGGKKARVGDGRN